MYTLFGHKIGQISDNMLFIKQHTVTLSNKHYPVWLEVVVVRLNYSYDRIVRYQCIA